MNADFVGGPARAPGATLRPPSAWGGDAGRKQASIAFARSALAGRPSVFCSPTLRLGTAGQAGDPSNVYCAAFGTADPSELEARSGLPASTLMLASAALSACVRWDQAGEDMPRVPGLVAGAIEAPLDALEAIRAGADPRALARRYVVDLLGQLAVRRDHGGRGLTAEQQALVRQLATLHDEGCTDPAAFRALRRAATAATDAATGDLAPKALGFVESVAWPLAGLTDELPELVSGLHAALRSQLLLERLSPQEHATLDALSNLYRAVREREGVDPTFDARAERERIETTPEFVAANEPALLARLDRYDRDAIEAYAPFAVDLLIGAFRSA